MSDRIYNIQRKNPLIHLLTNKVVANFTANGLLALGASPIMAKEYDEIRDISSKADGILLNIGTLRKGDKESYVLAGKTGNKYGIPVLLDPVGVSASKFRANFVHRLLKEIHFTVIKGNPGEMAFLAGKDWETKGVDSEGGDLEQLIQIAKKVSEKYETIAIISGKIDILAYQGDLQLNQRGHKFLRKATGTGCLLGAVVVAFLAANSTSLETAFSAVTYYTEAARKAVNHPYVNGPGTFLPAFIDELSKGDKDE